MEKAFYREKKREELKSTIGKSFKEIFGIEVPKGKLFYPCYGDDTYKPISLFLDTLDEFHFADILISDSSLPVLEVEGNINRKIIKRDGESCYFSKDAVRDSSKERISIINLDLGKVLEENLNFYIGNCRSKIEVPVQKRTWIVGKEKSIKNIYTYGVDGFTSLLTLDNISVFFYRGDSIGEGGSGQWWFGKNIFETLLDKMVEGGIILTDGANFDMREEFVPWKNLSTCGAKEDFTALGRDFEYIGQVYSDAKELHAWRVTKSNFRYKEHILNRERSRINRGY